MCCIEKNIFIVVPCYNEEKRLNTTLNEFLSSPYRFIFVNDGSFDGTRQVLETKVTHPNYCISLPSNFGKAHAVREGVLFIRTLKEYDEVEWIGYWDADMAVPISEISQFLEFAELACGADAIYGSRLMRLGSTIKRNSLRHMLGRIFCTLISVLFDLKSYDTQCGAKLFRKNVVDDAFGERFVSKWIFDIEIILRLRDQKQIEYPLSRWEDVKGSKITPLKTFPAILAEIFSIYWKYR